MAFRRDDFNNKDSRNLAKLRKLLPPREGPQFEWKPWEFLWSGGGRTLVDMGDEDTKALVEMMTRAYKATHPILQDEIENLWPT
jgi:hypothetical protein